MDKAEIISFRRELLDTTSGVFKELTRLNLSLAFAIAEDDSETASPPSYLVDRHEHYVALRESIAFIQDKSRQLEQLALNLPGDHNVLRNYLEIPFSEQNAFLAYFFPNTKIRKDIASFSQSFDELSSDFGIAIGTPLFTAANSQDRLIIGEALRRAKEGVENVKAQLAAIIFKESQSIEKTTKLSPTEVKVAKIAAWAAIIGALCTNGVDVFKWHEDKQATDAASKTELISEYRIRMEEAGDFFDHVPASENINVFSAQEKATLEGILLGGHALSKDARSALSWERIIQDLRLRYHISVDANVAADATIELEDMANGTRAHDKASFDRCLHALTVYQMDLH